MEPLSQLVGIPVEKEPLLSEIGYPDAEGELISLLRRLEQRGGAVVACSQGDVIPDLLHRIASEDRVPLTDDFTARKGSGWAMCFSGSKLIALEDVSPPDLPE